MYKDISLCEKMHGPYKYVYLFKNSFNKNEKWNFIVTRRPQK